MTKKATKPVAAKPHTLNDLLRALADGKTVRMVGSMKLSMRVVDGKWYSGFDSSVQCLSLNEKPECYAIEDVQNPHPEGTFAWAKFEFERGNAVTVPEEEGATSRERFDPSYNVDWAVAMFTGYQVACSDWKLVGDDDCEGDDDDC